MDTNKIKRKATFRYMGRYLLGFLIFAAITLTATVLEVDSMSGVLTKAPTSIHEVAERFVEAMLVVSASAFICFFIFITVLYLKELHQAGKR